MNKIYVLDTNVLLHDPKALIAFDDNEIVIPLVVIEELDTFKNNESELGRNARTVIRSLDEYRTLGNLHRGVRLPNGGFLRIELNCAESIPEGLEHKKVDNRIIGVVLGTAQTNPNALVILVSRDINMRVKCDALGVESQDYKKEQIVDSVDALYSGFSEAIVPDMEIDNFHNDKPVYVADTYYPNQFILLKSEINSKKSALARYVSANMPLKKVLEQKDVWGVNAKNKEQTFALNLLMDPRIKLVSLIGHAGVGKTFLALAAGLQQVIEEKKYERIIVSRVIQPVGRDLGYLPGSLEEKLMPWLAPIYDNFECLFGGDKKNIDMLKETGVIQMEALTYIRGRSIQNSYIIIDEAQNLNKHELKTIITRAGENSKIILTGDVEQVDSAYLDATTNGLSIAVERFKGYGIFGHITLRVGIRSELATLAAQIL